MTSTGQTVAITGATGFIGAALVRELAARGVGVRAFARPGYKPPEALREGVVWVHGRLGDGDAEAALCDGATAVVHLAGLTKAPSRAAFFAINAAAAGRLAERAAAAGCDRFVFASSLAAREPSLSDYAASKHAGEEAVRAAAGGMAATIVRIPAVFGPDDPATRPLLDMMRAGWLPAPGDGGGQFSLIFVTDLARELADLALSPAPPALISPVGAARVTWPELAASAGRALNKPVRLLRIPSFALMTAGFAAELAGRAIGRSGHLNRGKIREMLHKDWTGEDQVSPALTLDRAMAVAFGVDAAPRTRADQNGAGA